MGAAEKLSNELYIGPAPTAMAARIIQAMQPQVEKALAFCFNTHAVSDLVEAIHNHDMQLWNAIRGGQVIGIEITEILCFPRKKACNLLLTAARGNTLRSWGAPMLEQIETFARAQGCTMMLGRGRMGWSKLAHQYGFDKPFILSAKGL